MAAIQVHQPVQSLLGHSHDETVDAHRVVKVPLLWYKTTHYGSLHELGLQILEIINSLLYVALYLIS